MSDTFANAILDILKSGTGFGVEFACLIRIHQLEDGRFIVVNSNDAGEIENIFNDPESAVDFFLHSRQKRELGFDFETA